MSLVILLICLFIATQSVRAIVWMVMRMIDYRQEDEQDQND